MGELSLAKFGLFLEVVTNGTQIEVLLQTVDFFYFYGSILHS